MRIAVPVENGAVYSHFGHAPAFRLYDVEENAVKAVSEVASPAEGHMALVGLLAEQKADLLICGGIGMGALNALYQVGIRFVCGAEGQADDAVASFLKGTLEHNPEAVRTSCGCGGGCGCH